MTSNVVHLARSVEALSYEDIPEDIRELAKCHVLDAVISVWASRGSPGGDVPAEAIGLGGTGGPSTVLFSKEKTSPFLAAFSNAQRSIAMDFGSNLFFSQGLPGVTVFSALATAEHLRSSGQDLITAVVAGFEAAGRVALSLPPPYTPSPDGKTVISQSMPRTRWINFGGAAAVSKLLGLDEERTSHALALSGATVPIPAGPRLFRGETGAMAKYGMAGVMASTAALSASMASHGFTGDVALLDSTGAFHRGLQSELYDEGPFRVPFGSPWYMPDANFKRYPSATFNQQALFGVSQQIEPLGVDVEDIEHISVGRAIGTEGLFTNPKPANYVAGQFSVPHGVALIALKVPLSKWSKSIDDPAVNSLAERVSLYESPEAVSVLASRVNTHASRTPWGLEAKITLRVGGQDIDGWSDYGLVNRKEIADKWRAWAPPTAIEEVLSAIDVLEDLDVTQLTELLT